MISDKFYFYLLPSFSSDKPHYPYELPKGWVWTTLGEISNYGINTSVKVEEIDDNNWVLELEDIEKDSAKLIQKLSKKEREIKGTRHKFYKGNVLYSKLRTYLNKVLIASEDGYCTTEIMPFNTYGILSNEYICYVLRSSYFLDYTLQCGYGVKMPRLSTTDACNGAIPLPPLHEQYRIVKEIKRWFALISMIKKEKDNLRETIKQAKSKVLDLAIHGKLVPQNPDDEPAVELLKRINPKAEIITDNGHYQKLPKGWCLVKGKHIFNPMKSCKPIGETFKYIDIDAIDNKRQIISNVKILKVANAPSRASRFTQKGDVVFSLVRPYLRNIAIVSENDCIASTGFYVCHPTEVLLPKYCYHLMISDYVINGLNEFMKGDNSPSINKGDIDNWLFPIPPLAEQKRIVSKIEEIFSQFDAIETAL